MDVQEVITKTRWTVDRAHSEISFKVRHLMFSNVRGNFRDFDARVNTTGDDFRSAEISVWINPASVDTGTEARDEHLRSADFFDVEQYKEISLTAGRLVPSDTDTNYELYGDLSMRGVKKPIRLNAELGGILKDPWGAEKALFTISGKIARKDWGLNYNTVLEAGGVLVGEEVQILCEVQLIKQS